MSDDATAVVIFGDNWIMQLNDKPGVLFWTCPFAVDADGHPMAYHPDGSPPGLDYLANAGSAAGGWWGIACDSDGDPYIQTEDDEAAGFYVSTTALVDTSLAISDQHRYVHSGEFPFVVLPSTPKFDDRQKLGDLLVCFNNKTGMYCWAMYADVGPSNDIGEGSMRLAEMLGINNDPKTGGTEEEVVAMIYWPGSAIGWPAMKKHLATAAYQLFVDWGGLDSCKLAMPQFNWDQFVLPPAPKPPQPPTTQVVTVTIQAPPGVQVNVVQR